MIYQEKGEYKIALTYCFKAYKILIYNLKIDHPTTKLVYENMKYVYLKSNSKQDFDEWLEEKIKESNPK